MIEMRRAQLNFGDGLIAEEVSDLREDWMPQADELLSDEDIVAAVYEALARRHAKSRSRGRRGAPAEMVLRLLLLKHIRNWSYAVLEREVRANLVYRDFTRVGAGKTPDAKTMGRWGLAVGPEVVKQLHQRLVKLAQAKGLVAGRRMRVDTTVVETNVAERWRAGSDPHHEKGWQDRRRDWCQAVRPQSQREAAGAGHRPGCALEGQAEPGAAQPSLWQAAQCDQPRGGTSEAVLQGDRRKPSARGTS